MSKLNEFLKLASDETRFRIMLLLMQRELCVCQICGVLELPQPKVSKHLTKLRDTKFVISDHCGKFISYKLNIDDARILHFMTDVLNNSAEYPMILQDREMIKNADIYLSRCKTNNGNRAKHDV